MGEVYRARDSKLNRDIAIKVLPDSVANDPRLVKVFDEYDLVPALVVNQLVGEGTDQREAKPSGAETSRLTHVVVCDRIGRVVAGCV